jgi:hypothetical protein
MPNPIKYSTGSETNALKKGNFYIGTGSEGKGPSDVTGYYNGVTPQTGGYVIYMFKDGAPGNLSYHSAANDSELISFTSGLAGQTYTGVSQCFDYYAGQTDKVMIIQEFPSDYPLNYPNIVMPGLILNLDAGITQSYPGSGTTWYDLTGNGNNVILTNGPSFNTNDGGSVVFDGTDDYARNDTPTLPTGNVSITICAWIYVISGYSNQWQGIAGWGNRNTGQSALLDMNQGRLAFSTWGSVNSHDLISNYNVPLNTWKYVVGSISNRNIKLYADSTNVLDSSITFTPSVTSTDLRLATTDYPGRLLNVRISSVQIYNRVLSQTEITQNYNAQKGRFGL